MRDGECIVAVTKECGIIESEAYREGVAIEEVWHYRE